MAVLNDWTWLAAGLGVAAADAALIYIAWRALYGDKAMGRRRCPRCWYDLAYSPGMSCAECGFTAARESQFNRTRRRWGAAVLAIALAAGVTLTATWHTGNGGFASMVPTRVLLWSLPVLGGSDSDLYAELVRRMGARRLSHDQWIALINRCATGDWNARPTSDAWIDKYGNVISTWRRAVEGDGRIEPMLLGIQPRVDLQTRRQWPSDTPVVVLMQVRDWWPTGTECRVTVTPAAAGAKPMVYRRAATDRGQFASMPIVLPPPEPSAKAVRVSVKVERRRARLGSRSGEAEDPWQPAFEQAVSLPIVVAGSVDSLMAPASDSIMDEAIRQVFAQGAVRWRDGGDSPVRFRIDLPQSFVPSLDDTAIGVRVELFREDELARQLNLWWVGGAVMPAVMNPPGGGAALGVNPANFDRQYGFEVAFERAELLRWANAADGRWSLRVTGDPNLALRTGLASKFWSGQVDVPLQVMVRTDEAPQQAWRLVEDDPEQSTVPGFAPLH